MNRHTFQDVQDWYRNIFKNSGWVVLAMVNKRERDFYSYMEDIDRLLSTIDLQMEMNQKDKSRLNDLLAMQTNVEKLKDQMHNLLSDVMIPSGYMKPLFEVSLSPTEEKELFW